MLGPIARWGGWGRAVITRSRTAFRFAALMSRISLGRRLKTESQRTYPFKILLIHIWQIARLRKASKTSGLRSHRTTRRRYARCIQLKVRSA